MRRGISWNLIGAVSTNGMRVVVIAVLGRALTSADFGIVAAAISVNVILYGIRDVGVGPALVQRKELRAAHRQTAFAVSTYLGFALTAFLIAGAPWIGDLYNIPDSVDVIRGLAVLFALRGVSTTSRMLCQRELRFRAIAIIDAVSFALGSIASMVLAVVGLGPWALVIGYLLEEAIASALYLYVSRPPLAWRVDREAFRELMSFGTGQTISQIAGILATYGDNFVVGHALGAKALGFYTRAYDLIKFPSTVFATIVGNVLFPALSQLQDDRARLAQTFRRVMFVNALVLLPASALLVVLAPEAIRILVGRGWDEAIVPFQILAITMLLRTTQKLGAIVAQAAGRVNAIAIAYVVYMVFVIGGAAITIRWGIAGVSVSTAIAIIVVSAECSYLAMRVSGLGLGGFAGAHVPGLALAALVAGISVPGAALARAHGHGAALTFAVVGGASVIACAGVTLVALRRGWGDFGWLADEVGRLRRRRSRRAGV